MAKAISECANMVADDNRDICEAEIYSLRQIYTNTEFR